MHTYTCSEEESFQADLLIPMTSNERTLPSLRAIRLLFRLFDAEMDIECLSTRQGADYLYLN